MGPHRGGVRRCGRAGGARGRGREALKQGCGPWGRQISSHRGITFSKYQFQKPHLPAHRGPSQSTAQHAGKSPRTLGFGRLRWPKTAHRELGWVVWLGPTSCCHVWHSLDGRSVPRAGRRRIPASRWGAAQSRLASATPPIRSGRPTGERCWPISRAGNTADSYFNPKHVWEALRGKVDPPPASKLKGARKNSDFADRQRAGTPAKIVEKSWFFFEIQKIQKIQDFSTILDRSKMLTIFQF